MLTKIGRLVAIAWLAFSVTLFFLFAGVIGLALVLASHRRGEWFMWVLLMIEAAGAVVAYCMAVRSYREVHHGR